LGNFHILCGHAPLQAVFKGNLYSPVHGQAILGPACSRRAYQGQHCENKKK
jgi:hypothetical protein